MSKSEPKPVGRPALPEEERRVRLAGGPTVDPGTLAFITMKANNTGQSIGTVLDWLAWSQLHYHRTFDDYLKTKEKEKNED